MIGQAQFRKLWECFFLASGPHLVAVTPLRVTITGSKPIRRLVPYAYRSFDLLLPIPLWDEVIYVGKVNFENFWRYSFLQWLFFLFFEMRVNFGRLYLPLPPLWHTYSEPLRHEDSPGTTQNISYL